MTAADTARIFGLRRSNVIAQPIKKPDEIGSQHPSCFPENDDQSLCREAVEEFCSELQEQLEQLPQYSTIHPSAEDPVQRR